MFKIVWERINLKKYEKIGKIGIFVIFQYTITLLSL